MNPHTLLPLALDLLVKSSGILLLAFSVNSLWRNASAAQRCLVWGAAFAVLLLLPFTLLVPPRWSFAWERPQPAAALPATVLDFEEAPASSESVAVEPVVVARQFPRLSAPQIAVGVWIAGLVLVLGRRVLGAWQVRCLRLRSHALEDARVSALTTDLARESGVRRHIELRDSTHVSVPMTWGVFGPVLLLPRPALSWGEAPMKAALRHEIGHIRHCDALTRLAACVVCAAFWPNVLVWLAARAWRTAQEQACDDLVLRAGATRQDYAMQLLDAARGMKADAFRRAPVMAMARPSTLETRLSAIMDDTRNRRPLRGSAWLAGGGAALALLAVCTTLQLQAEDKSASAALKSPDTKDVRTIIVESKFIEVAGKNAGADISLLSKATLSAADMQSLMRNLSQKKGLDLMASPTLTTRSGQAARVEVARELIFTKGLEADGKTPKDFDMKPVGVMLDITATIQNAGKVTLRIEPMVRELLGWISDAKPDQVFKDLKSLPKDNRFAKPFFSERTNTREAILAPGEWIVCALNELAAVPDPEEAAKRTWCLVTAREVINEDKQQGGGTSGAATDVAPKETLKTKEKAAKIILPRVELRDATLVEALDFLRIKSRELDPAKEGLDIVLAGWPASDKRVSLDLHDVPVSEALRYVTELAGMKFRYDETAVTIISLERQAEERKKDVEEIKERARVIQEKVDEILVSRLRNKVGSQAASDAPKYAGNALDDLYFNGYLLWKAGGKLEQAGDKESALQKYLESRKLIQAVRNKYPDWQPAVVTYRLKELAAALSRLGYTERFPGGISTPKQ